MLHDAPAPAHLHEAAPVISGEDLPTDPTPSARELEAYFREAMTDWQG
jgi:hypothetical protein